MRVRAIRPDDAPGAAAWMLRDLPVPAELAAQLPTVLARLIADEVLRGDVVEFVYGRTREPTMAAFGFTGFLDDAVVDRYLASPYPHLELDLLDQARLSGSSGPLLDYDRIAHANAGQGLTIFPLLWLQRTNDPQASETRTLLMASQRSFLRVHRGYRICRVLKETTADRAPAFLAGGFRERHRLPAGTPLTFADGSLAQEHVVFEAHQSDFDMSLPGAGIGFLFGYRPPRCGFTRLEKQVLGRAVDHMTDGEIAVALGITPAAVALRWRSIYARIAERVPSALEAEPSPPAAARGKEKRRPVIVFLGNHPEELRPYPQLPS